MLKSRASGTPGIRFHYVTKTPGKFFIIFLFIILTVPIILVGVCAQGEKSIQQEISSALSMEEIASKKAFSENIKIYPSEAQTGSKIIFSARMNVPTHLVEIEIEKDGRVLRSLPLYDDGKHSDGEENDYLYANILDTTNLGEGEFTENIVVFKIRSSESIQNPQIKPTIDLKKMPQMEIKKFNNVANFTLYSPNCFSVFYSGNPEEKVDMVFLAENYSDLNKFYSDVLYYADINGENNGLLGVEPFKSNGGKFNFYFVNGTSDLGCELGCFGMDRLVCCDDEKVKRIASVCPHDQISVLIDTKKFCGASKDYSAVCTIDDPRAGLVLVHEFGHTFGELGDEYSYGTTGNTNAPNCDNNKCRKWGNIPGTGCFKTCGYTNLYRSTENGSLMNVYIPDFGPLDTLLLTKTLSFYDSEESVKETKKVVQLERSYVVTLDYNGGNIAVEKLFVTNSSSEEIKEGKKYLGKIISFDGKILSIFNFKLPTEWHISSGLEKTTSNNLAIPFNLNYTLNFPYFKEGETLEVYDLEENKLSSMSLAPFAETCGDDVCQSQENYLECKSDCSMAEKDNICLPYQDGICDPDCPMFGEMKDGDCKTGAVLISMGLFLIVLFAAFLIFKRTSK
ncbi:MAG: M64 family metallopeptidase [Nanoarchaeota archaeon]|nr:M64 family metallopeptidase [Nanoarchaeota archaeon]